MSAPVRLGYIDFLNSRPVYHALETGDVALPSGAQLVRGPPTKLNGMLARGEVDVSPVSSIEYAQHAEDLVLLPDLSINSAGFVHSVTLFYRNEIESVNGGSISVTDQSATSDLLLRILLEKRFGFDASVKKGEPDPEEIGHSYDGALFIGDLAMRTANAYPGLGRRDLGLEWTQWTGLPMVFAVWAARKDFARAHPRELASLHKALIASKQWGAQHREVIVERCRKEAWLPRTQMQAYFRNLNYDLDATKLAGLRRYLDYALERGAIKRLPALAPEAMA